MSDAATPLEPPSPGPPRRRLRQWTLGGARWGAAAVVLLLPAGLLVDAAAPPGPDAEMVSLMPLDPGTTSRYAVFDHGQPSGFRDRQVFWQGQDAAVGETVRLSSSYTDHPDGPGAGSDDEYFHVSDDEVLQLGYRSHGSYTELEPAAAILKAPSKHRKFTVETKADQVTVKSRVELLERTEITVSGRTFTDCAHYRSTSEVIGQITLEREFEEWLCPGFGSVRNIDRIESIGQERSEELVAFHGPAGEWTSPDAGEDPVLDHTAGTGTSIGLDQGRSRSVPGRMEQQIAWTDTRISLGSRSPAGLGETAFWAEYDGTVSALDTASGAISWRVRLRDPIVTAPIPVDGLVLVADGAKQLWALRADTGRAAWVHAFADIVSATPAVAGDVVVVPSDDGRVTGIDLRTGKQLWSESSGVRVRQEPAASADHVVTLDPGGGITVRSAEDGEESWSASLDGPAAAGPVAAGDTVYTADDVGVVYAHDLGSGDLRWQSRLRHYPVDTLAVSGDALFTIGSDDQLMRLSTSTGEVTWTDAIDDSQVAPTVVGDDVVTVSRTGRVGVHSAETGKERTGWQIPGNGALQVEADPGVVAGALVIPVRQGVGSSLTYVGYRLDETPASNQAAGIWFDVEVRPVGNIPAAPVTTLGEDLLIADFDRSLTRVAPDGERTTLWQTQDYLSGGVVMGDLVIGQRGEEWIAVPAAGGEPRWSFPAGPAQIGTLPAAGTVAGQPVAFLPIAGTGLAAVRLDDGKPVWVNQLAAGPAAIQPLVLSSGDVVYGTDVIARYDRATGEQVWSYPGATFATMAEADGLVFVDAIQGRAGTGLTALDAGTGKVVWHRPNENTQILVGPVTGQGKVVYVDSLGTLTVLDAATGEEQWSRTRSTPVAGTPVIADGVLYAVEKGMDEDLYQRDHRVWAHDLATGRYLGSYEPPAPGYTKVPAQAATPDGRLLVPTTAAGGPSVLVLEGVR